MKFSELRPDQLRIVEAGSSSNESDSSEQSAEQPTLIFSHARLLRNKYLGRNPDSAGAGQVSYSKPRRIYRENKRRIFKGGDEQQCLICWLEIKADETVIDTMCKHVFHEKCLAVSFKYRRECPKCKRKIPRLRKAVAMRSLFI